MKSPGSGTLLERVAARWTTPLDLDAVLSAWSPLWGTRLRGVVEEVVPLTESAASIRILPGRGWRPHRAGQYVTVGVDVDGVRHSRCYSLTSPADLDGGLVEITVQEQPHGTVSHQLVRRTNAGDILQLSGPEGSFTFPEEPGPLLMISGGSGITPLIGMLRTLGSASGPHPDVVLLHHARSPDRLLFGPELERITEQPWFRAEVTFTRGETGEGRLDASRLEELCPDWRDRDALVCGPEPILEFAVEHWSTAGLTDRLHLERFTPAPLTRPDGDPDATSTIRFAASGVETVADGTTTLLEVAERTGLNPPHGCRMGICHTCSTGIVSGCARDLRDGRILDAGSHVQLCVSAPAGAVTLDL